MSEEIIKKAKEAKTVEELIALAKENNIKLTEDQAKVIFDRLHVTDELPDEALEGVAGGAVRDKNHYCVHCESMQNCYWAPVGTSYGWICSHCNNPADWKDGKEVSWDAFLK